MTGKVCDRHGYGPGDSGLDSKRDVIAATIAQKPYSMAFVGMQMLDNLYHHKPSSLDSDWSKDAFSPVPGFVDTGSA